MFTLLPLRLLELTCLSDGDRGASMPSSLDGGWGPGEYRVPCVKRNHGELNLGAVLELGHQVRSPSRFEVRTDPHDTSPGDFSDGAAVAHHDAIAHDRRARRCLQPGVDRVANPEQGKEKPEPRPEDAGAFEACGGNDHDNDEAAPKEDAEQEMHPSASRTSEHPQFTMLVSSMRR